MISNNVNLLKAVHDDGTLANIADEINFSVTNNTTSNLASLTIQEQSAITVAIWKKFGLQICLDIMGKWKNDLSGLMLRDSNSFGEFTEIDTVNSDPAKNVKDYDYDYNPFATKSNAETNSDIYGITDQKQWSQTLNAIDIRRAMLSSGGIYNMFSSLILKSLETKANLYMFKRSKQMYSTLKYSIAIEQVSLGEQDPSKARVAYTRISNVIKELKQPLTTFNERGYITQTPIEDCDLILNTKSDSKFNVDVIASLFHSEKIGVDNIGRMVTTILDPQENTHVIGYLCDRDKFRMEQYLKETWALYNGIDMTTTYWLNLWLKCGIVTTLNGMKLQDIITPPVVVKDTTAHALVADCTTRNASIYYKLSDGADFIPYTGPVTYDTGKTYVFKGKVDDSTLIPDSAITSVVITA